jgi:hypothetical protein
MKASAGSDGAVIPSFGIAFYHRGSWDWGSFLFVRKQIAAGDHVQVNHVGC